MSNQIEATHVQEDQTDSVAFRALTEPFRAELQLHCYRMLGSLQDAEDAVQESLLHAWRGFAAFEGRSSLRTWLYRIATHQCLNALRSSRRRPAKAWDVPHVDPPAPTQLGEVTWLEPYPDALVEESPGPDARFTRRESLALAFVTALQRLPPSQLAVLVLRDVVGFAASEVAEIMESTVDAANSSLKRARATMDQTHSTSELGAPPTSSLERTILAQFVSAWESADVEALTRMLTDDVFMSMPPIPFEYLGPDAVAAFCARLFLAGRRFQLVPTRANGQPAFGVYLRAPRGISPGVGLYVVALRGDRISALSRFESHLLPKFGLPAHLPERPVRLE